MGKTVLKSWLLWYNIPLYKEVSDLRRGADISFAKDLIQFIDASPNAFFAVAEMKRRLTKEGFQELNEKDKWKLKKGGRYFVTKNDSAMVAFQMGMGSPEEYGFHIIGSHSDSPGFQVKPNPEMKGAYLRLNTEVYGGPILNTWLDRALSLAGRVVLKGKNPLAPVVKLVNIDRDLCVIPNLAIHMNREVNSGFALNPQEHTLPVLMTTGADFDAKGLINKLIAEELKVKPEDILASDLFLYDREGGKIIGAEEEFVHVGRLDNLAMAHVTMAALIDAKESKATNVMVVTDNEEVGSLSRQGADSTMVENILSRIARSETDTEENYLRAISHSFLISSDLAHALHPNFEGKCDPTNRPVINGGVAIKAAANRAYTSDAYSVGVFRALCEKAKAPYQMFVNRSDARGGSTIGPITQSHLDIPSVDIGNPIFAMHSVRELGGVKDHYNLKKVFDEFFK